MTETGTDNQKHKKNWAQRFSNELATTLADELRPKYRKARVTPHADGSGQEFTVGGKVDRKRTDVGVWDDAAGLVAGVSIKTMSFRDFHGATKATTRKPAQPARIGRYVRNVKRNDMELRDEADTLHRRQPYAFLVAVLFLPEDACWDGITGHSSFAHIVFTLRKRTGRRHPGDRPDLFERTFVGLYTDEGAVRFFDVTQPPPKNQPPRPEQTISMSQLVDELDDAVVLRNTGASRHARYSEPDPDWSPPAPLPAHLDAEDALDLDTVVEEAAEENTYTE